MYSPRTNSTSYRFAALLNFTDLRPSDLKSLVMKEDRVGGSFDDLHRAEVKRRKETG